MEDQFGIKAANFDIHGDGGGKEGKDLEKFAASLPCAQGYTSCTEQSVGNAYHSWHTDAAIAHGRLLAGQMVAMN